MLVCFTGPREPQVVLPDLKYLCNEMKCNFGGVKLTSLHPSKRWLCWKSCSLIHEANYLLAKPLRIKAHSTLQTLISVNTVVLTGSKQSGVGQCTFMFTEQEHLQPSTIIMCGEQIADSSVYLPPPPLLDVRKRPTCINIFRQAWALGQMDRTQTGS